MAFGFLVCLAVNKWNLRKNWDYFLALRNMVSQDIFDLKWFS